MSTAGYLICAAARKLVREAHIECGSHTRPRDISAPCKACAMELRALVQMRCGWPGARWSDLNAFDSKAIQGFIRTWNDGVTDAPRQILKACVLMDIRKGSRKVERLRRRMIDEWTVRLLGDGILWSNLKLGSLAQQEAVARSVVRLVRKLARVSA